MIKEIYLAHGHQDWITPNKGIWIPESLKFLLLESVIPGFALGNTAQGIRNPAKEWNLESKSHWQRLESSTRNPESMEWNPESKMVLDSLTLGKLNIFNAKGAMNQWFVLVWFDSIRPSPSLSSSMYWVTSVNLGTSQWRWRWFWASLGS